MREILFRGQTRRKGEKVRMDGSPVESNWVYGGVLCGSGDHSIIYQTEPDIAKKVVYTDTLGQYTGLTDKNGTKIFEGDIVRHYCKLPVPGGEIGTDRGTIKWDSEECFFFRTSLDGKDKTISAKCEYEIIGNIYDNPELIGGEQNG